MVAVIGTTPAHAGRTIVINNVSALTKKRLAVIAALTGTEIQTAAEAIIFQMLRSGK